MIKNIKLTYCFGTSFLLHGIILLSLFLYWNKLNKFNIIDTGVMPIYNYQLTIPEQRIKKNIQKKSSLNNIPLQHSPNTVENKLIPHHELAHKNNNNHYKPEHKVNNNDIHRELLKILHNEIANNQTYPETALQLNQHGLVTIGFLLKKNGGIINTSIIKSSGYENIDAAALAAVKNTSPLTLVSHYLQHDEYFSIDLIFE